MSLLENKELESQVSWMRVSPNYLQLSAAEIQEENRRVLAALKQLETRLDRELDLQKHARVGLAAQETQADPLRIALEAIKNNETCIRLLERDLKHLRERREDLAGGLESRLSVRRHELEKRLGELRGELKRMRLEENEINKKLSTRENPGEPEFLADHARLEEELRVFSIKYMKLLERHNRAAEQLAVAVASAAASPELRIPEELYDKELEEREEAQFREYQGIVKMCTILAKRNDSEGNKFHRLYAQKLKELEKSIVSLGQIDRAIALKEGEILEGKKNLELIKFRAASGETDRGEELLSASQAHLRRATYSTARLPLTNRLPREREMSQGVTLPKSLSRKQDK